MGLMLALPFTAHAWLTGWYYRSEITLSSATSVVNYQVKVELTSSFNYSHAQTNGEDLRFADASDVLQDYWIEEWNASGTSTIWVEVATSGTSAFYMYYDNSGASAATDGDATFIFFDDFEGANTNWTTIQEPVDYDSGVQVYGGSESVEIGASESSPRTEATVTHSNSNAIQFRLWKDSAGTVGYPLLHGDGVRETYTKTDALSVWYHNGISWNDTGFDITGSAWNLFEFRDFDWSAHTYDIVLGTTVIANDVGMVATPNNDDLLHFENGNTGLLYYDNVLVRQYTDPEPVSTVGSEVPLPVVLSSFFAQYINSVPTIYWTTQSETNNIGWNLYRSESENPGQMIQINFNLIPGSGTTSIPTNYIYEDEYEVIPNNTYWYWIESIDCSGETDIYGPSSLTIPEEGENIPELPTTTVLKGNYPNPFNPDTKIEFDIAENETANLVIYNARGQILESIVFEAGEHTYQWDASEYGSGVYLYELKSESYTETKKMILLK